MEDVIVVGGGPAGSSAAFALAKEGYRVTVLEEHARIGDPENCAGLVGAELFSSYDLPSRTVLRDFDSASFYSPSGEKVHVQFNRPMAYVVQRAEFDRAVAQKAESVGATYLTGTRCTDICVYPDRVGLTVQPAKGSPKERISLSARAAILATGIRSGLQRAVGLSPPARYMEAAHTVVQMRDVPEIEVFLGREWAPGYFAWALPFDGDHVRIGICSEKRAVHYLKRFFSHPMISRRLVSNSRPVLAKIIPVAPVKNSYGARCLVVGDAAGQVKPTTGGGIGASVVCGHIAGASLAQALSDDDLTRASLKRYETAWQREMMTEFHIARGFQTVLGVLSDRELDRLVALLRLKKVREILRLHGDFDRHGRFLLRLAQIGDVASLLGLRSSEISASFQT
ncbi:MAG: NAD(P)/FAD-dependent oxidoreductase [Nitrospinota bacterium]